MRRQAHRSLLYATALSLLATAGCDIPNFQGPQVQTPPQGFTRNPDTYLGGQLFEGLQPVYHDAWVQAAWGDFSGIYINGYAGVLSRADLEDERNAAIATNRADLIEYGEIESLTVDGRAAWGWTEWRRLENGGLDYVLYRALIPYDTISYSVEFLTGDPSLKIRPDSLRAIVASFGIGETTWNMPLIALMAGVLLILGNTVRSRMAAKAARARSITLVHIPTEEEQKKKKEEEEEQKETMAAAAEAPAAGAEGPDDDDSIAQAIAQRLDKKEHPPT